jgi:uncharacterized membrane protein YkoI
MTRTIAFSSLLATAVGLFALGAAQSSAQEPSTTPSAPATTQWLPLEQLVSQLEAQGYTVLEAEREDGRYWEVEMTDANGMVIETYLDAATGAPLPAGTRRDDD